MQRKKIIWSSVVSLLVLILGGITIYLQPDEFSIVLKDGTIKAKYSDGVMKVYSGRYLAYSDNIRPYYWDGKGYTKMYKSSKCGFKYSNLSESKEGDVVYVKQDLCYSKGIVTRYFEITEYKIKKAFEFVPFEESTRTKYKWYFESLDLGKAEVYLSKDIRGTRAVMDFGIINDWSKEIDKTVRVQRYLNGKMMIEISPITGNVSYDPEIILEEPILNESIEKKGFIGYSGTSLEWIIEKTGAEEELEVEYNLLNDTATEFCIKVKVKDYEEELIDKDISNIPITILNGTFNIDKNKIDFSGEELEIEECFIVSYDKLIEGMQFKIGWDSVAISTSPVESGGGFEESWNHRVFYDPNNGRWHVLYIDALSDINISSSSDGITWVGGGNIDAGSYAYDGFSCILDVDGSNTYLHCVYATNSADSLNYRRIELTGSDPFVIVGGEEIPFDSSSQGGGSGDDVENPRITIDSNRCLLIAFGMEDASEATAVEHEIVLTKEASSTTCGDGDWDGAADTETGFPIFGIQNGIGYANPVGIGIESFGDLDAQIFWMNTTVLSSINLDTAFFNGTSNSVGQEIVLGDDVAGGTSLTYGWSVIIGDRVITFAGNKTVFNLDAYITIVKNGSLDSKVDTGIDMDVQLSTAAYVTAIIDTKSDGGDDIWVFAVDRDDDEDIWFSVSPDGGDTWQNQTLWEDEAGIAEVKFLSAFYNEENCDIMVSWLSGASSPFVVFTKIYEIRPCPDIDPPSFSAITDNSSATLYNGTDVQINITIEDATNVDFYTLTHNDTAGGTWINETIINIESTSHLVVWNYSIKSFINTTGGTLGVRFWANDTGGYSDVSDIHTITVQAISVDTCSCPGLNQNHEVDHSDSCNLGDCELGTGKLNFTGSGETSCTGNINTTDLGDPGSGILWINNSDCIINVRS